VIILALLAIALGIIFFGYKFDVTGGWWDVVSVYTYTIMNNSVKLPAPQISVLLFSAAGVLIMYAVAMIAKLDARRVVAGINRDDTDARLTIQYLPRPFAMDMMNLNSEYYAIWVWLAPRIARIYVVVFVAKYVLSLILLWIANKLGWQNTILGDIIVWGLSWLMDVNGVVTLIYGIVVWCGIRLHEQEQLLVTDIAAMQQQITRR
jgi:hypothetical protein